MSFLSGLSGDFLKRLSGGNMDPAQPNDQRDMGQLMGGVPQDAFQQHTANALSHVVPQEYQNHITPGVGGTNPLGGLGKGLLGSLAGLELSIREHFAGYRSHTTLLAGVAAFVAVVVTFFALGKGDLARALLLPVAGLVFMVIGLFMLCLAAFVAVIFAIQWLSGFLASASMIDSLTFIAALGGGTAIVILARAGLGGITIAAAIRTALDTTIAGCPRRVGRSRSAPY